MVSGTIIVDNVKEIVLLLKCEKVLRIDLRVYSYSYNQYD
jgi:hypothetical protein